MPYAIQQSVTTWPLVFLLVQTADHISGLTGASPTVTLSKNGASFGSAVGAVSEIANGWYKVAGNATDVNTLGPLILHATASSGDPTDLVYEVVSYNPQSGSNLGLSALPTANPGSSNGLIISGSNSGTTTLGALTVTGALTVSDGIAVSRSSSNSDAVSFTGSGTGDGFKVTGGATGNAFELIGGSTSGDGMKITTTSGHGMNIAATGSSKHGITATGGNAGTSDGIKGVAGTGGVDIRGNITGNVTGNLSGSVGSVTGAVGSVTANVTANVASFGGTTVTGRDIGASVLLSSGTSTGQLLLTAGAVTVGTNNDKTGYTLSQTFPTNFSSLAITAGGAVTVGTNNDKSGYSLTQTFPANFSLLAIDGSGDVTYNNAAPPSAATIASQVLTSAMTESYAALHASPTLAQAVFEMRAHFCEKSVVGTTLTTKKIDGATTAETFTLNDAVSPTSITRAT